MNTGSISSPDWLPGSTNAGKFEGSGDSTKVEGLAAHLGLEKILHYTQRLYTRYRGRTRATCSFKETEAYGVCACIDEMRVGACRGVGREHTARAFARSSDNRIPLLFCRCLPTTSMPCGSTNLWIPCVKLICSEKGR